MAVVPIRIVGDPVLHTPTTPVRVAADGSLAADLAELITDLYDTMDAAYGVGLAANQIGVDARVFVVDCPDDAPLICRRPQMTAPPRSRQCLRQPTDTATEIQCCTLAAGKAANRGQVVALAARDLRIKNSSQRRGQIFAPAHVRPWRAPITDHRAVDGGTHAIATNRDDYRVWL